jgi:hypothetical protein
MLARLSNARQISWMASLTRCRETQYHELRSLYSCCFRFGVEGWVGRLLLPRAERAEGGGGERGGVQD